MELQSMPPCPLRSYWEVSGFFRVNHCLTIDCGRHRSKGNWHSVSRQQFDAYYASQESGVGVWVEAAKILPKPIALSKLRQNWGHRWQPPQQIQQLTDDRIMALSIDRAHIDHINERYGVRDDLTAWRYLMTDD